jgi:hypothetical protein
MCMQQGWVDYSRDPWRRVQCLKPNRNVSKRPDRASDALNHFGRCIRVSPRGRVSIQQTRQPCDDLLHQFSIAREYKYVPEKCTKVSLVPTKHLPHKPMVLRNVGSNFGFGDILY